MTEKRNVINIKNADLFVIKCKNCTAEIDISLKNYHLIDFCPNCKSSFSDGIRQYLEPMINFAKLDLGFEILAVSIDEKA